MEIVVLILSVVLVVSSGFFVIEMIKMKMQNEKLSEALLYAALQGRMLREELEVQMQKVQDAELADDDGFIKFLSESRQWAFDYIEQVQKAVSAFKNSVDSNVKYYEKAGHVVDSVHKRSLEEFVQAYRELEKILPNEEKTEEK